MTDHNDPAHVNHRTAWTQEEATFLVEEWDGTFATAEVIADLLGRTLSAVTQRWYEIQWGHTPIEDMPFEKPDEPRQTATRRPARRHPADDTMKIKITRVTVEVELARTCPNCYTVRALDGSCLCD